MHIIRWSCEVSVGLSDAACFAVSDRADGRSGLGSDWFSLFQDRAGVLFQQVSLLQQSTFLSLMRAESRGSVSFKLMRARLKQSA
jgi:hypothetical protein